MSSAYLFVLCQALDLRVLQIESLKASEVEIQGLISKYFEALGRGQCDALHASVWSKILATWPTTTTLDLSERCAKTADAVIEDVVTCLSSSGTATMGVSQIATFSTALKGALELVYNNARNEMYAKYLNITPGYLGKTSQRMYTFVRQELGVRFHRDLIEHPTQPAEGKIDAGEAAERKTIGSQISVIYEAFRNGRLTDTLTDIVEESVKMRSEDVTTQESHVLSQAKVFPKPTAVFEDMITKFQASLQNRVSYSQKLRRSESEGASTAMATF